MALSNLFAWSGAAMAADTAAACGSSCGAGDKSKPSACGSACGAGDNPSTDKPAPSSCGAGDAPKPSACGAGGN